MVTERLSDVSESEGGIFSGKKRKTPEKSNRLQVRALFFKDPFFLNSSIQESFVVELSTCSCNAYAFSAKMHVSLKRFSVLQDSLMRALECSVCMNIMVTPVYQCQAGHSICK